jgi:hypothetical protein
MSVALRGDGLDFALRLCEFLLDRDEVCRGLHALVAEHGGQAIAKQGLRLKPLFGVDDRKAEIFGGLRMNGDPGGWRGNQGREGIKGFRLDTNGRTGIDAPFIRPVDRRTHDGAAELHALRHVPFLNRLRLDAWHPKREIMRDRKVPVRGR